MQIVTIVIISLTLIGWSSKPLFSHADHHKTEIEQETKEHSEHHNQMHPKNQTKPVTLPSSSLKISATNTDNLAVKPEELIFLLLIASPFVLHLLKNKMYNHE